MKAIDRSDLVKFIIVAFVILAALFVANSPVSAQGAIACGETVTGKITDADFSDEWTFEGIAGQTLVISMSDARVLDTLLYPSVGLYTPGGSRLASNADDDRYASTTFRLEHNATYTIVASRLSGSRGTTHGGYNLHVRCAAPRSQSVQSGGGTLSCGQTVSGRISDDNWIDEWEYVGRAGQTLIISMSDARILDTRLYPSLGLYAPGGGRLASNADDDRYASTTYRLEHDATYTITASRLSEARGSTFGGYNLHLRCAVPRSESVQSGGGTITCGQTVSGRVSDDNWIDEWKYSGRAGQTLIISMSDARILDTRLYPSLGLYAPSGSRLASNADDDRYASTAYRLEHDATYTITASRLSEARGSTHGGYNLHLRCAAPRSESVQSGGGVVGCGQSVSGRISDENWIDEWQIALGKGEQVQVDVSDARLLDTRLYPSVGLYTPGGSRLTSNADDDRHARISYRIEQSAVYIIAASRLSEARGSTHGGYELLVECAGTGEPVAAPEPDPEPETESTDDTLASTTAGTSPTRSLPGMADLLLGIDRVSCSPSDSYFILSLKSAALSPRLFEITVSTQGNARIARILPIPAHGEETKEALTALGISLVGDGIEAAFHIPFASTMLVAGAEMGAWIDQQFERNQGAFDFRWTWYNTTVHPAINDYLVHVTHSGGGTVSLSTRQAPMSDLALYARQNADQRPEAKGNKLADWLSSAGDWVMDKVWGEPLAYWAERLFREDFVAKTDPLTICP